MALSRKQRLALKENNLDLFFDYGKTVPEIPESKASLPNSDDLQNMYDCLNWKCFNGRLPRVQIEWSTRMRAAGKFYLGRNLIRLGEKYHEYYPQDIEDTLKHEMLHILYPNHGKLFKAEAKRIGTSIHAKEFPGGKSPYKYIYICPVCGEKYNRHRYIRTASCGKCSPGGYDKRFKLKLYWSAKNEKK